MSILIGIVILGTFVVLALHISSYYDAEVYSTIDDPSGESIVFNPGYVHKNDTNEFLEIIALMILATSIFYAGILNYLKETKS